MENSNREIVMSLDGIAAAIRQGNNNNIISQSDWGFINSGGGGINVMRKVVTFPIPFKTIKSVHLTPIGQKAGADPANILDLPQMYGAAVANVVGLSLTQMTVELGTNSFGNFGANERWAFSWEVNGTI